jgi:calcineurin-like phosphoesterase family protein
MAYYDWLTSDIHFSHVNIIKYSQRPHVSVEHMNQDIVARWNAQVGPTESVLVVGDVAMGKLDTSLPLVGSLNGHLHLLTGNHDRCASMHGARADGWTQRYLDAGFETVTDGATYIDLDRDHRHLPVCHFPYQGDSGQTDRYEDQRPGDDGSWLIHGHVHDKWRVNNRMVNVGIDAWGGYLVTPAQIVVLIEQGPHHAPRLEWDTPVVPAPRLW